MISSPKVLLFGGDAELLRIRALVLSCAGFRSSCATTMEEFELIANQQWIDVLLLCHSLPLYQREAAVAFAWAQQPFIRVVALYGAYPLAQGEQILDAVCDVLDGPQHLLTTLQTVVCFSQVKQVPSPSLLPTPC